MTPTNDPFDADFAAGEKAAKNLEAAMERANKRAQEFEKQAEKDAAVSRRKLDLDSRVRREVAQDRIRGETIGEKEATRLQERARSEEAVNQKVRQRNNLLKESERALTRQEQIIRRIGQIGPYAYTRSALGLSAAQNAVPGLPPPATGPGSRAGGSQRVLYGEVMNPPGLPPGGGAPPPYWYYQRALPPGPQYPQLPPGGRPPLQIGQGSNWGLPRPGETVGGSLYTNEATRARGVFEEQQRLNAAREQFAKSTDRAAAAEARMNAGGVPLGRTMEQNRTIAAAANSQYQRFGALSTEWIGAAARGTTTIRELGNQTLGTIGKFGGWILAGSAVFAALDAVRQLGTGALDSASGVNQLQRVVNNVNPDHVTKGFRALSQEFNLPIADVSDAAFQMGKIFHDQDTALEASRAVLYSVKVGELDVATATRYLTAIVNGFNLTAGDQTRIFDQINQAQNRFGVSINDTEAGIAKAAGTFRSAGGDFDHLLAIITTAQKATGNTGQVVGTALARAPNFLRQAQNQAALAGFGIDARANIDTIIEQAFEKARGLSGRRLQELSAAIFGPQYGARIGTPLLQQEDLYRRVLKQTSPEASKGSAKRELETLLGSIREQIARVGVELQSLGSNLASAGFLDAFGLFLKLLNNSLHLVNQLLEAFNNLPEPIRKGVVYAAQLYAIVRTLRHFNAGEEFAAGSFGRGYLNSPRRDVKLFEEGLGDSRTQIVRERESAATRAARAGTAVAVAEGRQAAAQAQYLTSVEALSANQKAALSAKAGSVEQEKALAVLSDEERTQVAATAAAGIAVNDAQAARNAALARQTAAEEEEIALLNAQIAIEGEKTLLAEARNDAERRRIIGDSAYPGLTSATRPTSGLAEAERRGYVQKQTATGPILVPAGAGVAEAERGALAAGQTATKISGAARLANLGVAGRALGIAGKTLWGVGRAGAVVVRGLYGLAAGVAAMLGPLDLLLIAGFVFYEAFKGAADQAEERTKSFRAAASQAPRTKEQFDKATRQMRDAYTKQTDVSWQDKVAGTGRNIADFRFGIGDDSLLGKLGLGGHHIDLPGPGDLFGLSSGDEQAAKRETEAYKRQKIIRRRQLTLLNARNEALRALFHGEAAPTKGLVFPEDEADAMDKYVKDFIEGPGKSFPKFREKVENLVRTIRQARNKSTDAKKREIGAVRLRELSALGGVAGFDVIAGTTPDQLQTVLDNYGTLMGAGIARPKDTNAFIRDTLVQITRSIGRKSPQARSFAADALTGITDKLGQMAQDELQRSLTFANSVDEENKAYAKYFRATSPQRISKVANDLRKGLRQQLQTNRDQIAAQQKVLRETAPDIHAGGTFDVFGNVDRLVKAGATLDEIKKLRERGKTIREAIKRLDQAQKLALRELAQAREEERQQRVQDRISLINTQAEIGAARIERTDPVGAAQRTLAGAQKALDILRQSGAKPGDIADAVLAVINAQNAVADAVEQQAQELADATEALAVARAGDDPVVAARAAIANARSALSRANTLAERRQALADLISAQNDLDAAFADIAQARLELISSRTDDPVKQANIAIREANARIQNAHGQAERLQAQADRAEAVRQRRDAIAQKRIDDIEFQADIGKLTTDQEIAAYERLLKTVTLSRDMRRDIRRKIYDLKHQTDQEGSFDLAVGDIRLPTIYDIRRAVQGGINSNPTTNYQDNRTQNIAVNVPGGNQQTVERALDNVVNGTNRSSRRSAGLLP